MAAGLVGGEQPLLDPEHGSGGVAGLGAHGGDHPPVPPAHHGTSVPPAIGIQAHHHLAGQPGVGQIADLLSPEAVPGPVGHVLDDLPAPEGGGGLGHPGGGAQLSEQRLALFLGDQRRRRLAVVAARHRFEVEAHGVELGRPPRPKGLGVHPVVVLGRPGDIRRHLASLGTQGLAAGVERLQLGQHRLELAGALAHLHDGGPGHAGDVGQASLGRLPLHPQAAGQAQAQLGGGQEAGRLGVGEQRPAVQRPHYAVGALGHVGHHHMCMQLGIQRPGGPVQVGSGQ